jgi:hypothetical protein
MLLKVCGFSDRRAFIGWQTDTVDGQPASPLLLLCAPAGVLVDAGPFPVLRSSEQAPANRVQMDILHSFVALLDVPQRAVEACPELVEEKRRCQSSPLVPRAALIDIMELTLTALNRDAERVRWRDDGVPAVGEPTVWEKNPGRERKPVPSSHPRDRKREQLEILTLQNGASRQQLHVTKK